MNIKRLAIGGGKKSPSQFEKEEHAHARHKSLRARLLRPCALCLVLAAAVAGCADADIPQPSSPQTRADSIAAGLLVPVPTADGAWDGETVYDFDGNPVEQLGVSGSDSDAAEGDDGHTWGE